MAKDIAIHLRPRRSSPLGVLLSLFICPKSLSHRPVGELTNTGVGAMGLKRGRPVQLRRPLVGPQKGRPPLPMNTIKR